MPLWHACVHLPVTFWSLSLASWVICSHSMWAASLYHGLKDAHHYLWCMPCCMLARLSKMLVSSGAAWPVLNQPAKPTALEQRKRQLIALCVCHRDQPSSHTAACVARAACGWDAVAADCRHGSACWSRGALHKHGPPPTTGTHPLNTLQLSHDHRGQSVIFQQPQNSTPLSSSYGLCFDVR